MEGTYAGDLIVSYIRQYPGTEAQEVLLFLTDCANGRLPGDVLGCFSSLLLSQLSVRGISGARYWAGRDDQLLFPYDSGDLLPDTVHEVRQFLSAAGFGGVAMGSLGLLMQPGIRKYSKGQIALMSCKLALSGKYNAQDMGMQGLKDLCDAACDRAVHFKCPSTYGKRWALRVQEFLGQALGNSLP